MNQKSFGRHKYRSAMNDRVSGGWHRICNKGLIKNEFVAILAYYYGQMSETRGREVVRCMSVLKNNRTVD